MTPPRYYISIDHNVTLEGFGNPSKAKRTFNSYVKTIENNTNDKTVVELFVAPPDSDDFTRKQLKKIK